MKPTLRIKKPPPQHPIPVALDSGAFSIYHREFAPKLNGAKKLVGADASQHSNFEYTKTKEFQKYFDEYMEFLRTFGQHFRFYVTLDAIYQPKVTWDLYREMLRQGLHPMPVIHFGAEDSWLKKYMETTDYIGIGGLGSTMTKKRFYPYGDAFFRMICDAKGRPKWKVHGFAVASFEVLKRYPWYSVDSSTARVWANYGQLMLPRRAAHGDGYNYLATPFAVPVTEGRATNNRHVDVLPKVISDEAMAYAQSLGFSAEDIRTDHWTRSVINYHFMDQKTAALVRYHRERMNYDEYQLYYYTSGITEGGIWRTINDTFDTLKKLGAVDHLCYLGTFYTGGRKLTMRLLRDQFKESV
jgi:hypothetical protein